MRSDSSGDAGPEATDAADDEVDPRAAVDAAYSSSMISRVDERVHLHRDHAVGPGLSARINAASSSRRCIGATSSFRYSPGRL